MNNFILSIGVLWKYLLIFTPDSRTFLRSNRYCISGDSLENNFRSCLNFISELFESCFRVDFLSHLAGNSGLFPKDKKEKMPKTDSKKPKPASQ